MLRIGPICLKISLPVTIIGATSSEQFRLALLDDSVGARKLDTESLVLLSLSRHTATACGAIDPAANSDL